MLRLEFELDTNQVRREIENLFYDTLSRINNELPQNKVIGRIVIMQVPESRDKTSVDADSWKRDVKVSGNLVNDPQIRDILMPPPRNLDVHHLHPSKREPRNHPRRDVDPNKMHGFYADGVYD